MNRIVLLCLIFLCFFSSETIAQVNLADDATLGGKVYSDYYWMVQHHNEDIEGENGFWFRRIYLTYNRDINEHFTTRVRLEMNSAGDFQSDQEMIPSVKDAYLKWQNEHHAIIAGISGSPLFGLTEDIWGYRAVEKSPQDLYDFGSSRDFGLAFKGELGDDNAFSYHLFLGNGNSNKPEIDKGKKVSLALGYSFTDHILIEGYADYHSRTNNPNSYTAQLLGGYQSEQLNVGALYSSQYHEGQLGLPARSLDLIAVFANIKINDTVKAYLRADHLFDGYLDGSDNSYIPFAENVESTFIVAGTDVTLADQIHLMPNIETIIYGQYNQGISPNTDIIPRLTLFFKF